MIDNFENAMVYINKKISIVPVWSPALLERIPPYYYLDNLNKKILQNSESKDPKPENDIRQELLVNQCKIPMVKWVPFQKRIATIDEVAKWFKDWPEANIGVITGKISNLVVFDLDSPKAFIYTKEKGGFPETVKVSTGKGEHVWAQYPGFYIKPDVNKQLDMDIRGDGGFVVAPPSFHGSGNQYQWFENRSISDLEIAPCSEWMKEYLQKNATGKKKHKPAKTKPPNKTISKNTQNSDIAEIVKNGCQQGNRNQTAAVLAGSLIKTNKDRSTAWEIFRLWNTKNDPPLSESELDRIFASISSLEGEPEPEKNKLAPQETKIDISSFLDSTEKIISDYSKENFIIPFAGENLHLLERKMNGGLQCGCFYILGGIPSAGKTLLTNNIVDNICLNKHPVLFFSYDDTRSEVHHRTLSRFSNRDIEDFNQRHVSQNSIKNICEKDDIKHISQHKYVVQNPIPLDKWPDLIKQVKEVHKKKPVIIVDYLRKLNLSKGNSDERLRVDSILTQLTDFAKKYDIPVLAISELGRDSYKSGQRLSMASFKESGTIEYEASWLGILAAVEERNGAYHLKENWDRIIEQDGNVDLIVFKAKRGTGKTGKIPLKFNKTYMNVEDRIEFDSKQTFPGHVKESQYS